MYDVHNVIMKILRNVQNGKGRSRKKVNYLSLIKAVIIPFLGLCFQVQRIHQTKKIEKHLFPWET